MTTRYSMKQVCTEANLTYETLKFYCNQGLVPNVKRDANNRRVFDERDLEWVKSLICLKNCSLSIREMKVYLDMCLQGPASIPDRQKMLAVKREELEKKLAEIQEGIDYIDWKLGFYDNALAGQQST